MNPLEETRGGREYSLSPKEYAKFLHRLFCRWKAELDSGKYVSVHHFDNWIGILMGRPPESCNMRGASTTYWMAQAPRILQLSGGRPIRMPIQLSKW